MSASAILPNELWLTVQRTAHLFVGFPHALNLNQDTKLANILNTVFLKTYISPTSWTCVSYSVIIMNFAVKAHLQTMSAKSFRTIPINAYRSTTLALEDGGLVIKCLYYFLNSLFFARMQKIHFWWDFHLAMLSFLAFPIKKEPNSRGKFFDDGLSIWCISTISFITIESSAPLRATIFFW